MQQYSEVVIMQEQELEGKTVRNLGNPDAQNYI